jgi:radical SAM superfamily enzyme YgiQ (UPF0313 family)
MASRTELEAVKTVALAQGVRIQDGALRDLGGPDALTVHEYPTTGGITLVLEQEVLVNAPFDEPYCAESPLRLSASEGRFELRLDGLVVPVQDTLPLPGYLNALDGSGRAIDEVAMSHGDRIRLSPIEGCAFDCSFCDMGGRYVPRSPERIVAALEAALDDRALPARHVLISGGSPGWAAAEQDYYREVCVAVIDRARELSATRDAPLTVDIMMSARKDGPEFVDRMVEAGVNGFSFNLEVFSEEPARNHLGRKHKSARPLLAPMIERAVEAFDRGSGRVRSLIIPGLESTEQTLEGVDWLASMGCDPVLSPFRPARGTALAAARPTEPGLLDEVLIRSREIVRGHGVRLGPRCVPCQHNTLSFPWDVVESE